MQKTAKNVLFLMCVGLLIAQNAFGWDDVGHKITGYIAWQRLTPQARENVIKVLRAAPEDSQIATFYSAYGPEPEAVRELEYFMLVPTWGDIIRDRTFPVRYRKYHHSNWHYDDTFWRQVDGRVELAAGFEEGGQAVSRLIEFDKVLKDPKASNAEKAVAIAWLMHLAGDIHQPLHTSGRVTESEPKGDQGGNLFLLTPTGTPRDQQLNLHWFWDSIVKRSVPFKPGVCESDYLEAAAKKIIKDNPYDSMRTGLELGQYDDWRKESFAYNNTVVFSPDLRRNQMPSEQYRRKAFKLAGKQLALAGYRIGDTLNAVFNVTPPSSK